MELFEAQEIDVEAGAQGRNRGIVLGQVGIRCRHVSNFVYRYGVRTNPVPLLWLTLRCLPVFPLVSTSQD